MRKQSESMKQWRSIAHSCCVCGSTLGIHAHHKRSQTDPYWEEHPDEDMDAPGNLAAVCLDCHAQFKDIIGRRSEPWGRSIENNPIMYGGRVARYYAEIKKHHPREPAAMLQYALLDAYVAWFTATDEERKAAGK